MIFYRRPTDFKKWVNLTNLTTGGGFTGREFIYNFLIWLSIDGADVECKKTLFKLVKLKFVFFINFES